MPSIFDEVIDRRNSGSAKWNWFDADVLPAWVADMDFRCPEPILKALHKAVDHGAFGYEFDSKSSAGSSHQTDGRALQLASETHRFPIHAQSGQCLELRHRGLQRTR